MSLNKQTESAEALWWERLGTHSKNTDVAQESYAEFYFRWDSKPGSKWVCFLLAKDRSDSYAQNGLFKGKHACVVHGSVVTAITQTTPQTLVTEVGGAGTAGTCFTGALLMGNGVTDKLGVWTISGCSWLPFIKRRENAKGTTLALSGGGWLRFAMVSFRWPKATPKPRLGMNKWRLGSR